jgi:hypothetical protein
MWAHGEEGRRIQNWVMEMANPKNEYVVHLRLNIWLNIWLAAVNCCPITEITLATLLHATLDL